MPLQVVAQQQLSPDLKMTMGRKCLSARLVERGVTMSDHMFLTLLVAGAVAVWIICKTIREAAWTATPEAARKEAAERARFVEKLKQEERQERRDKWAARLSWMNTVAAAFPDWMFKETRSERAGLIIRLTSFALFVGFLYAVQRGWLG